MRRRTNRDVDASTDASTDEMLQRWATTHRQREASPSRDASGTRRSNNSPFATAASAAAATSGTPWNGPNYDRLPETVTLSGHTGMRAAFMGIFRRGRDVTPEGVPVYVSSPPFRRYLFKTSTSGRWAVTSLRNNFTESACTLYSTSASSSPVDLAWMVKLQGNHVLDRSIVSSSGDKSAAAAAAAAAAAYEGGGDDDDNDPSASASDANTLVDDEPARPRGDKSSDARYSSTMDRWREAAGNFRRQPLSNFRDPITGVTRLSPSQMRERTFVDHVDDAVELLGDALSWCSGQARRLRGIQGDDVWAFAAREVTAKRVALAVLAFAVWTQLATALELYATEGTVGEVGFVHDVAKTAQLHRNSRLKINLLARPLEESKLGSVNVGCGNKTFFIGPHRTGVDAIHRVFRTTVGQFGGHRTLRDFTWRKGDRAVLRKHDLFIGGCSHDVGSILAACPKAHYIYQTRNLRDWLTSNLAWAFAQRHYIFAHKYRKLPWLVRRHVLPRFYHVADELTHGCGVPEFSRSSAQALLHQRLAHEVQLGRIFPQAVSDGKTWTPQKQQQQRRWRQAAAKNHLEGPKLLVWETSFSPRRWDPLFQFMNHTHFRLDEKHLHSHFLAEYFRKHDSGGLRRKGAPPATAYRCIKYAAGRLADAVLKATANQKAVAAHCAAWPQFCAGGVLDHGHIDHGNADLVATAERLSHKLHDRGVAAACHRLHDYSEVDHDEVDELLQDREILAALAAKHRVRVLPGAMQHASEKEIGGAAAGAGEGEEEEEDAWRTVPGEEAYVWI